MGKNLIHKFSSLFGFLLLGFSVFAIAHELRQYNYQDILNSFKSIPKIQLIWAIGLTGLGYLALSGYDILALHYVNHRLSLPRILFANFISNAFSNSIGLAFLTSSAIHYRFYSVWGVPTIAIAVVIAFVNLSFCLGLFALGGVMFIVAPLKIPPLLNLPWLSVRPIGFIFLIVIVAYLLSSILIRKPVKFRDREFRFPSFRLAFFLILVSCVEWALAASVIYTLLPPTADLSYPRFLSIYLLGMGAGVISNVPGGLGVFETIVLFFLSPHISGAAVFGSLLAYRCVYYFLPLFMATGLLGAYEIKMRSRYKSKD